MVSIALLTGGTALAEPVRGMSIPAVLAVNHPLQPAASGVTDLKFAELFKMPVGPRGLELSEKAVELNGRKVRLVGFMVRQDMPTKGMFIFASMPLELGDEDESLSDDLPPGAVFVHIEKPADAQIRYIPSLIKLTGTLQLGPKNEIDGHVSSVRLLLDDAPARSVLRLNAALAKRSAQSRSDQTLSSNE